MRSDLPAWLIWGIPLASITAALYLLSAINAFRGRDRALRRLAASAGMTFHETDPVGIGELRFSTFAGAKGVRVTNVVSIADGAARAFDYSCWTVADRSTHRADALDALADDVFGLDTPRPERTTRLYTKVRSGAVVQVRAFLPPLTITPASWVTRSLETAGLPDMDFESDEFNRGWDVRCGDRRFAQLFVDAQLIDLILGLDHKVALETFGNYVLFTAKRCTPPRVIALARAAGRVPGILSSVIVGEYPTVAAMESRSRRGEAGAGPRVG